VSLAVQRFEELRREFRRRISSRKLSPRQLHDIKWAAALQQCAEMAAIENVAHAAKHDRRQIDLMRQEVTARLASAGVRNVKEKQRV
jgi:hypothetical protein